MLRAKFFRIGERLIQRGAWYLAPISWLYAFAVFCRNQFYDLGLLPIHKVDRVVVSVGNIVAGGTGKTPFVLMLAKAFHHRKVALLSRGYGEVADEALLLAKRLPHVEVLVGKDRVALAKRAQADLLILDDGFQYRRLARDFDIVLMHSRQEHYLPWGFLRESPKRLKGVDLIHPNELKLCVNRILTLNGEEIPSIRGWKVAIFCGIARPERFKKTVVALGAEIVNETYFADHERADLAQLPKDVPLLCTEKDFVKLPKTHLPIYYLEMEMEWVGSQDKWEKLVEKIDQKIDNQSHL